MMQWVYCPLQSRCAHTFNGDVRKQSINYKLQRGNKCVFDRDCAVEPGARKHDHQRNRKTYHHHTHQRPKQGHPQASVISRKSRIYRLLYTQFTLHSEHECTAHFCHLNHFCHSSPVLSIHVNHCCQPHHFRQLLSIQRSPVFKNKPRMSLQTRSLPCQQGPTTFVNRDCIAYLRVLCTVIL